MSSSSYPLSKDSELSKKVLDVLKEVKQNNEEIAYSASCGEDGQYDNSYYDGQGVAEVRIAMDLLAKNYGIRKELDEFKLKISY